MTLSVMGSPCLESVYLFSSGRVIKMEGACYEGYKASQNLQRSGNSNDDASADGIAASFGKRSRNSKPA